MTELFSTTAACQFATSTSRSVMKRAASEINESDERAAINVPDILSLTYGRTAVNLNISRNRRCVFFKRRDATCAVDSFQREYARASS